MIDSSAGAVEILRASQTTKITDFYLIPLLFFYHFGLALRATGLGYGQYFLYLCPVHNAQKLITINTQNNHGQRCFFRTKTT